MTRQAGRGGALFVGTTQAALPSSVGFVKEFKWDYSSDKIEVTALGDSNKVYVQGLPDFQLEGNGFDDIGAGATNATALYNAAVDGLDRAFYLYKGTDRTRSYWYGRLFFDVSGGQAVDGAAELQFKAAAAGVVTYVP